MSFTISLPFLYRINGGIRRLNTWSNSIASESDNLTHSKAILRVGCNLIAGKEQESEREERVDSRRVHIAGEQLLCGGREVSYQRKEEGEREKTSILFDKVATISVCFKPLSNWRAGELHL